MPAELGSTSIASRVRIVASPVVELAFSLYIAEKAVAGPHEPYQAWAQRLGRDKPELFQRVANFWATPFYHEWAELIIFAQRLGKLFAEPEAFLARMEEVASRPFVVPELESEGPGVREILQDRLDRLVASPQLRAQHLALVRDFWAELKPEWEQSGKAIAEEMVHSLNQRLERTDDVRSLLPRSHFAWREGHADLVRTAAANGEAVIVPLALAGVGTGFFSLPHFLLIASGPDAEKRLDQRRARSEKAAARFKLLSDPTRVSILTGLCRSPFSIGDLAVEYGLSQPTISVHVKMLREAGLLESTKTRGQTFYQSSPEKLVEFIELAKADLMGL